MDLLWLPFSLATILLYGLGQVFVKRERARQRTGDLGDLQGVGQAHPVVVSLGRQEHLRLVLEAPERLGMHDPVAVALEARAQHIRFLDALPALALGGQGRPLGKGLPLDALGGLAGIRHVPTVAAVYDTVAAPGGRARSTYRPKRR